MGVVRERHPEVTQHLSDLRGPTSTQKSSPTNKGALRLSRCRKHRLLRWVIVPSVWSQRGAACKDHQEHPGAPQELPRTPRSSPGAPRSSPRSIQEHPRSTQKYLGVPTTTRAPRSTQTRLSETGSDFHLGQIWDPFYVKSANRQIGSQR